MYGESGFERIAADAYFTEPWVTQALVDLVSLRGPIWEPAAGRGDMADVLVGSGHTVKATDLHDHGNPHVTASIDFLRVGRMVHGYVSIVTNPPYDLAEKFIRHALLLTKDVRGQVAMLLRNEYDCAARRLDLFNGSISTTKIVLTKRPRWAWWDENRDDRASPRHNFAWFLWDWDARIGQHTRLYGPRRQ